MSFMYSDMLFTFAEIAIIVSVCEAMVFVVSDRSKKVVAITVVFEDMLLMFWVMPVMLRFIVPILLSMWVIDSDMDFM